MVAARGKANVAGLHVAELTLDDAEGVLDVGPDHRDDAVDPDPRVDGMQVCARRGLVHDAPDIARPGECGLTLGAGIALVGTDRGLLAVQ